MAITRMLLTPAPPIRLVSSPSPSPSPPSNASFTTSRRSQSDRATSLKAASQPPQPVAVPPSALSAFTTTLLPTFGRLLNSLTLTTTSPLKTAPSNLQPQMLIQKAIIDCRFLTLFAVLGSFLASVFCFIEGFSLVIQSYAQCFHIWSNRLDQGHVAQLLIEAIDMFLVGTGMLNFGVALYVMFVGSKAEEQPWISGPDFQRTPRWVGIESIGQAKSKIGHAVIGGSIGEVEGRSFGDGVRSCVLCGSNIDIFSLRFSALQTSSIITSEELKLYTLQEPVSCS